MSGLILNMLYSVESLDGKRYREARMTSGLKGKCYEEKLKEVGLYRIEGKEVMQYKYG